MKEAYYKQILDIYSEKPSLKTLRSGERFPEAWPMLIKSIKLCENNFFIFDISDLHQSVTCEISNSKMSEKISALQVGQVIFLYDSIVEFDSAENNIKVNVNLIYTLKEVNDGLPKRDQQNNKAKKRVIKVNLSKYKSNEKSLKTKLSKEEHGSCWRTLSERWQKQGKISE